MSIETDGDLIGLREAGDVTRETLDALEFYTDKEVTIAGILVGVADHRPSPRTRRTGVRCPLERVRLTPDAPEGLSYYVVGCTLRNACCSWFELLTTLLGTSKNIVARV